MPRQRPTGWTGAPKALFWLQRTDPPLRALNEIIRQDMLQKEYLCITAAARRRGLTRHICAILKKTIKCMCKVWQRPGYKKIVTQVQVLKTCGPYSLCRIGAYHRAHAPDSRASGVSRRAGAWRHQIWQPQDECARGPEYAGAVRSMCHLWAASGRQRTGPALRPLYRAASHPGGKAV